MLELAGIVVFGILAQWVAWRFKLPAILPLLLIGLLVGPVSTLFTEDGMKIIEPVWNGTKGLFPGDGLYYFVSLAIGIILFEGGLTLKREEIKTIGPVISKLITLGSAITFFGAGVAAHYIFGLSWEISFLFSGLIIVTGPTVITPILRNIPLKKDVSSILKWEGILIDPIGALVAVLVFEFVRVGDGGGAFTKTALLEFGKILLFGFTFGFTFAHALQFSINKKLIPHYLLNVVSFATVILVFVVSDIFAHESGLLAVVVMGMVLGNGKLINLDELLYFKESLSLLLVSILFILLAANINLDDLLLIYNWKTLGLFVVVVFAIRPLGVFLSTIGSDLSFREALFISWVGPRGIVAAGIASLFGSRLLQEGVPGAEYITPLVFMIVLGTVVLNATTARLMAKVFGVFLEKSEGILIIGGSKFSRLIANYLSKNNRSVVLIDRNDENISKAKSLGIEAFIADIYSDELFDNIELNDIGYLMALTPNAKINTYAVNKFSTRFGENGSFRLVSSEEIQNNDKNKGGLFSYKSDFKKLSEVTNRFPAINETDAENIERFKELLKLMEDDNDIIPLFIKRAHGEILILPSSSEDFDEIEKGDKIVSLGKPIDVEKMTESTANNNKTDE